ncbi:MAG TPA: hypothetical protein VJ695_09495 [Nitrososphaera sp.]|nr:hypothetical protein [Nitrososphaera sp.]
MMPAKEEWHLLRVQGIVSPSWPDKFELNYEVGAIPTYVTFNPAVTVHPYSLHDQC